VCVCARALSQTKIVFRPSKRKTPVTVPGFRHSSCALFTYVCLCVCASPCACESASPHEINKRFAHTHYEHHACHDALSSLSCPPFSCKHPVGCALHIPHPDGRLRQDQARLHSKSRSRLSPNRRHTQHTQPTHNHMSLSLPLTL